jgi:hypothetical protein
MENSNANLVGEKKGAEFASEQNGPDGDYATAKIE